MLNWIDYSLIAFYVVGLIVFALLMKRMASQGLEHYYLGGRRIPWWAMGISGMSSQLDMAGTMIIMSLIFMLGMRGMFIEIRGGLALIMAFAMVYMGKWNRRSGCMTQAEWMEYRFGTGKAGQFARYVEAVAVLMGTISMLAYFTKGAGLFLSVFFPYSPMACALIMLVIAGSYTIMSGFYGVVFTDIFQAVFVFLAMGVIAYLAFTLIPDNQTFVETAMLVTGNAEWNAITIPAQVDLPSMYAAFQNFGLAIVSYVFVTIISGISKPGGRPMYFGARSERECGTLTATWILASSIRWPMIIALVILGTYLIRDMFPDVETLRQVALLIQEYVPTARPQNWGEITHAVGSRPDQFDPALISGLHGLLGPDWAEQVRVISFHGSFNAEQILPAVIYYVLPAGFRGLLFVAMMAAAMSTFDSTLNMGAAYFVRDIYQRKIRPRASDRELISVSHLTCVVIIVLAFLFAYQASDINELWGWIMAGLGGGLAFTGVLRWYWWRFNGIGYACGTVTGMLAALAVRFFMPGSPVWFTLPVILASGAVGALSGTFLSKPTTSEVLRHFYRTTRPFGWWGPLFRELDPEQQVAVRREHRNDIISLFFAVPWQFLLYWTPAQFMLKDWTRFSISLVLLGICSWGLYVFWYRNLPTDKPNQKPVLEER
jgi:solute:Na+ symporter, SSS family